MATAKAAIRKAKRCDRLCAPARLAISFLVTIVIMIAPESAYVAVRDCFAGDKSANRP